MATVPHAELQTEYTALNQWRISKLQRQDQWGAILFPSSIGVFTGAISLAERRTEIVLLAWLASGVLLLLWRWYDHHNDRTIRRHTYPRLVELEELLGFKSLREYLRDVWWPERPDPAWLPTRADVEGRNAELDSKPLLEHVRGVAAGRPLFKWDSIALLLWGAESLLAVLLIAWR